MSTRAFHPAAEIFPLMAATDLAELADDIGAHGLREPIWLHQDGRIIDGRNRYLACEIAGINPDTRTYEGDDAGLTTFVISLNLKRRQLSASQLAIVAAKIAALRSGVHKGVPDGTPSMKDVADQLHVGRRTIARAKVVQAKGVPELVAAVERGAATVTTAAKVATLPAKDQRKAVAKGAAGIRDAAKSVRADMTAPRGKPLNMPKDTSPEALVRAGMSREDNESSEDIAKSLGLAIKSYRQIRYVILLTDQKNLSTGDRSLAECALAEINTTRRLAKPLARVAPIIARVFGRTTGRTPARAEALRQEIFDRVMGLLSICGGLDNVEIPYLNDERKRTVTRELRAYVRGLRGLLARIAEIET